MGIVLDHIFVCCDPDGPEAEALVHAGFVEGSRNVHPGQGTANRRFFFHGGFIELLWVHDAAEASSPLAAPTRLLQRWQSRRTTSCPFGIAFGTDCDEVPSPPFKGWSYRPVYLPETKSILFAEGTALEEPELFYLGWPHTQMSTAGQPKNHPNGFQRLLSASVGVPAGTRLSDASNAVKAAGLLGFHTSPFFDLCLQFEGERTEVLNFRPALPLVISARKRTA